MTTLFVADLHLRAEAPSITEVFLRFLQERARQAEGLYILGDLYEYWIGDDAGVPAHRKTVEALATVSAAGVPVYVCRGNRDFLLGDGFARAAGCQLLPDDGEVIDLHGTPTLVMHGDALCTDDVEHQEFRKIALDPQVQARLLGLPIEQRDEMARMLREKSKSNLSRMAENIMDVNPQTVEKAMRERGVRRLIHGHTHRPDFHNLEIDGEPAERIVLSDWHAGKGSVLLCDGGGCRRETLS